MIKGLILLTAFAHMAFGQQFWQGTRYGMSKAELKTLFGSKLKVYELKPADGYDAYTAFTVQQSFCGGTFEAAFIFVTEKPADRMLGVQLSASKGESAGTTGECVLKQYMATYGTPLTTKKGFLGNEYMFAKARTTVELTINPETDLVMIKYGIRAKGL